MTPRFILRFTFLTLFCVSSFVSNGIALGDTNNPDIMAWIESFDVNNVEIVNAPKKMLIAGEDVKDSDWIVKKSFRDFDHKSCHVFSYLNCVNGRDFDYALKINHFEQAPTNDEILGLVGANAMLIYDSGVTNLLMRNYPEKILIQNQEKISSKTDVRKLLKKVFESIGYDAVVLEVRGRFVLVGGVESDRDLGLKFMSIFKKSEKTVILKQDESSYETYEFSIVDSKLGYAIGRLPDDFSDANLIPGQKVRFKK